MPLDSREGVPDGTPRRAVPPKRCHDPAGEHEHDRGTHPRVAQQRHDTATASRGLLETSS
jgi:hypothetical protein